jgi:hypothetical protein
MGIFLAMYTSRREIQYQVGEVFSFKFELAVKGILITTVVHLLRKKNSFMNPIIHNLLDAINLLGKMINNIPINTFFLKHGQELYGLSIEFSNFNILCR